MTNNDFPLVWNNGYLRTLAQFLVLSSMMSLAGMSFAKPKFQAAQFLKEESPANIVHIPKWLKGDVDGTVRCQSVVDERGTIWSVECFHHDRISDILASAIQQEAWRSKAKPAGLNGHTESVFMQFTMLFRRKGKHVSITVVPN